MIKTPHNLEILNLKTALIGAGRLEEKDWDKLWNYVYQELEPSIVKTRCPFYMTPENDDFPECWMYIQPHNYPYAVHISLNTIYRDRELERGMDIPMHNYIQWLGFTRDFADIVIHLRRLDYCKLIIGPND